MTTRTLKVTIEYDGTDFAGWQVQPDQRTVQAVLEGAFSDLAGREPSRRPPASGRPPGSF